MRLAICGTYSSGKTLTSFALSRLTGLPTVRARTMREIAPVVIPGRSLAQCTAAELIQMIMVRHVDRAVHEHALGVTSFLSDGTSLQEWVYGAMRVHVGINPDDPFEHTPEIEFYADVLEQIGHAVKRHVRVTYDAFAVLRNELPLAPDGHRPVNDTFRRLADARLRATVTELGIPFVVVQGSLRQRLVAITDRFGLPHVTDLDSAVAAAKADYAAAAARIEVLRELSAPARRPARRRAGRASST